MTPESLPLTLDDLLDGVAYMMADAFEKYKALEKLKDKNDP